MRLYTDLHPLTQNKQKPEQKIPAMFPLKMSRPQWRGAHVRHETIAERQIRKGRM
jgi:hypothetical protein